jgi:hypothetical protein
MEQTTQQQYEEIILTSYERGQARGHNDRLNGYGTDSPLSGEWAGESITELLGDLIARAEQVNGVPDNSGKLWQDICDNYEAGYFDGNGE